MLIKAQNAISIPKRCKVYMYVYSFPPHQRGVISTSHPHFFADMTSRRHQQTRVDGVVRPHRIEKPII